MKKKKLKNEYQPSLLIKKIAKGLWYIDSKKKSFFALCNSTCIFAKKHSFQIFFFEKRRKKSNGWKSEKKPDQSTQKGKKLFSLSLKHIFKEREKS